MIACSRIPGTKGGVEALGDGDVVLYHAGEGIGRIPRCVDATHEFGNGIPCKPRHEPRDP